MRVPEVVDVDAAVGGPAAARARGRGPGYAESAAPLAAAVPQAARGAAEHRDAAAGYGDPVRVHQVEERVAVDSARAAVGGPSAGESAAHMAHVPAGVGASTVRHAVPPGTLPAEAAGALQGVPPGSALPGGVHADVVSEAGDSKSLVLSGGAVSGESGVIVMLPGAGPGGTMGAVRVPLASYVKGHAGIPAAGGFFSSLSGFMRYGLIVLGVVAVILGSPTSARPSWRIVTTSARWRSPLGA